MNNNTESIQDDESWGIAFEELKRQRRFVEAQQWISRRFDEKQGDVENGLLQAKYLNEVRAVDACYSVYTKLLEQNLSKLQEAQVRLAYARRLFAHGLGKRAWRIISDISIADVDDRHVKSHINKIGKICRLIENLEQRELEDHENTRILAFRHVLMSFSRRTICASPQGKIGRVTLLTGSLGAGGAERQISRMSVELTRHYQQGLHIDGLLVDVPVDLVLRSVSSDAKNDFFLPEVINAGCCVHEIDSMPVRMDLHALSDDPQIQLLLSHQPGHVTYGLSRLVDFFHQNPPDCLAIWQDGACLYAVLAGLLAGVPKIQIGLRGLPPVLRQHLQRPEYEPMYRALDCVPGVYFLANSDVVAKAYSDWVDIPSEKFRIVYNGVIPPETEEGGEEHSVWESFVKATPDANRTIGGVFRFASDKRPNLWIRFAQQCAASHPDCRFVIVGDGDLLSQTKDFAEKIGIMHRILFVGASKNVGFWMEKMDVLVLLSQFEGLPNVLIEAQLMSIPVVTTPAGGAKECFIEGVSGICLDAIEPLNFQQAVRATIQLADSEREELFTAGVKKFLADRFSVQTMLGRFVGSFRESIGVGQYRDNAQESVISLIEKNIASDILL